MATPAAFINVINSYLPEPHASLLNGIIFGAEIRGNPSFLEELKAVGLLHIVVLSGMNITMLASAVSVLTSFLGKLLSILITILTIILFIFFVGPKAPIVRAGIMGSLTLVSIIYGRRSEALYSLFFSFLIIAIVFPEWLSGISLYLSCGATLGIILFGPGPGTNRINSELRISLAAQVFTAPMIFLAFRQVSLVSPLSNLAVAPAIGPLMVFGYMAAILGRIDHDLGIIPSYICFGILDYMVRIIGVLSGLPLAQIKF